MESSIIYTAFYNLSDMWSGNVNTFPGFNNQIRPLLDEILRIPDFSQEFDKLLNQIYQNLTNPEVINKRIDALASLVQENVCWDHSISRNQTNINEISIDAQHLFNDNSTDLAPLQNDFGAQILNNDVNGTESDRHNSLAGIKEWFSKQYSAFNSVDSPPTATVSVVEPIEPTATPVVEVFAVLNADNFTRQTSPVPSENGESTRQSAHIS